jgi:hypothetical protein
MFRQSNAKSEIKYLIAPLNSTLIGLLEKAELREVTRATLPFHNEESVVHVVSISEMEKIRASAQWTAADACFQQLPNGQIIPY